jgi:hypothetical protein
MSCRFSNGILYNCVCKKKLKIPLCLSNVCCTYLEVKISRFEIEGRALITGQTPFPRPYTVYGRDTVYVLYMLKTYI